MDVVNTGFGAMRHVVGRNRYGRYKSIVENNLMEFILVSRRIVQEVNIIITQDVCFFPINFRQNSLVLFGKFT